MYKKVHNYEILDELQRLRDENKELKEKLSKGSAYVDRFNMIVENSYEWVWEVDTNGIYTYASPQVESVLGYKPEEIIGKTPFDFMSDDEAKRVSQVFSEIVSNEEVFTKLINTCICKNGNKVHTETSGQPFYNESGLFLGYRGIDFDRTQDVIEFENIEKALKEQKEAFETIFEYSSDGTLLIEDGKFIDCNRSIIKMMRASSKEDLLMTHPSKLAPEFQPDGENSFEKGNKMMNLCLKNGHNHFECVYTRKDGENFWAEVLLTKLNIKDKAIIHVSWRDISHRKTLETELENSNTKYKQLISELDLKVKEHSAHLIKQSRMAQMGELLSMIAHQWRQPLSSIAAVAIVVKVKLSLFEYQENNIGKTKDLNDLIGRKMNDIEALVGSLSSTIDDFRTLYKPDKIMQEDSIIKPIDNALSLINLSFIDNNITVIESHDVNTDINMYSNEIMQVILNLLKNAEDNFLDNNVQNPIIYVRTRVVNDYLEINISDNGGGVPLEIQDQIFNPYFSTKSEKNGTGLGLYMCKIIIEEHHKGEINIFNVDEGACFCIKLPISRSL